MFLFFYICICVLISALLLPPTLPYLFLYVIRTKIRYIFGGGFIGFRTNSKKRVTTMQGKADGYWSTDGANWVKINYGEFHLSFFCSRWWFYFSPSALYMYIFF